MDPPPSKPPHKKLQNDVAGIDADFGSIYVIPAATDYRDDEDDGPMASTPHQLINFGPQHEKLLIIPDYKVTKVVPGVERRKLISSDQMVKPGAAASSPGNTAPKAEKDAHSNGASPGAQVDTAGDGNVGEDELRRMISPNWKNSNSITPNSPLTCLVRFDGSDGAALLDMMETLNVKTLSSLVDLPSTNLDGVSFLKDTGMFSDIATYANKVKKLLDNLPKLKPTSSEPNTSGPSLTSVQTQPSNNQQHPTSNDQLPSHAAPSATMTSNDPNLPKSSVKTPPIHISQVPGMTEAASQVLFGYAMIQSAQDLAEFPTRFPGLYAMLKDVGEVESLEDLISMAKQLCLSTGNLSSLPSASSPDSGDAHQKLGDTAYLKQLGEVQNSQVPIQEVTRNTLVGALKGLSMDLATELSNLYPPIHSIQALATFAEVKPTEYAYLLRRYPELSELCQQAALLVSVAAEKPKNSAPSS